MSRLIRPARPASFARNYTKTLLQTAAFWSSLLIALPVVVSRVERSIGVPQFEPRRALAVVVFVGFGAMALSSSYTMARIGQGTPLPLDTARELVIAGFYRHIRNPMAVAGLTQGAATGLWLGSYSVFGYVIAGAVFWNVAVRPVEEADLAERFGAEYETYRAAVRCWIPRLTPYRPGPPG
jgi:protein-S-isoprenylcysteine O-methyltransferase Ste14